MKNRYLKAMGIALSPGNVRSMYRLSLYKNAGYLMLNSAINAVLGFVFWILAARFYTSADVGVVSALIAAMGLLTSLALMGLNIGLVRFLPDETDRKGMINSCFTIVGSGSFILAVVFILGTPVWSPALTALREEFRLALAFVAFTVVTSLALIQGQAFIALRAAKYTFGQQAIWQGLKVALIVALASFGVFGILSSWGIAGLVALLVGSLFLMRRAQPGYLPVPQLKPGTLQGMMRFTLGNYAAETIGATPNYILPLLIVNLLGAEPSAYFRMAWGIGGILFIIPSAIMMALFAEGSHEPEQLRTNVLRAVKLALIILVPAILIIVFFGDKILLLMGEEYSVNAYPLLVILAISSIAVVINDLYVVIRRVELQVKPVLYVYAGQALTILTTGYVLIDYVGLNGAGLGWLLGQGLVGIFTSIMILAWFREK